MFREHPSSAAIRFVPHPSAAFHRLRRRNLGCLRPKPSAGPSPTRRPAPSSRPSADRPSAEMPRSSCSSRPSFVARRGSVPHVVRGSVCRVARTWGFTCQARIHLSPCDRGIRGSSPSRHHAARAAASPHIRSDPRRSKPQSRMLAGAGLGGMGPFLGARRVSATVPLGHHPPRIRRISAGPLRGWVARWSVVRPLSRASARRQSVRAPG